MSDPKTLETALWWVQRWISGSMNDPAWSFEEAESMGIEAAFEVVQKEVGNARSANEPVWRYLSVSERTASRLEASLRLQPHEFPFQSFTTSARLAAEVGAELARPGEVSLLVCALPTADDVMFGLPDLLADPRSRPTMRALEDWHNQEEVLVRVREPLTLQEVRRIDDWDAALAEEPQALAT